MGLSTVCDLVFPDHTHYFCVTSVVADLVFFPLVVGVLCLFCSALLYVLSNFAIILKRKRELVALSLLSYGCFVTVNVL